MSTYRNRAEQRAVESDRTLLCTVDGCPNRWCVDFGRRLCSAHDAAPIDRWAEVTQQQLDAEASRAFDAQRPRPADRWLSKAERGELMARVRQSLGRIGSGGSGRVWAHRLKAREEAGEPLTSFQREAWRAALHAHGTLDAAVAGADVPRAEIDDALQETGDMPTMTDDEALWAARFAERNRLAADPRFAGWAAGSPA